MSHEYVAEGPRSGLSGRGGRARLRGAGPGRPRGSRARGGVTKATGKSTGKDTSKAAQKVAGVAGVGVVAVGVDAGRLHLS